MTETGWIKLHRCLFEKAIWTGSTPEQKVILITLLGMANHTEKEWEWRGERYQARPGQFVTSLKSIAQKCGEGVSIQNVRTALGRFEKFEFLTSESTNKNRLVTIVNWEPYQSQDGELTKRPTSDQQATNKQLTTNKNERMKEVKNYMFEVSDETPNQTKKYDEESKPYKCAAFLSKRIKERIPNKVIPERQLQSWAYDFDKTHRLDKQDWQTIAAVLDFSQTDDFWQRNILSGGKFRKQFDQLFLNMQKEIQQ